MTTLDIEKLDWNKTDGLMPAIIQDSRTLQVLMMGYMNNEAIMQTYITKQVTFYSRTKKRLWTKGETSGHALILEKILQDCDNDTLLILVKTNQPCCHLNFTSCFGCDDAPGLGILPRLEQLLEKRYQERPQNSYTTQLFEQGAQRIAQKVGEEGLEVALASVTGTKQDIISETADLIFHVLVLLRQNRIDLSEVFSILQKRLEEGERQRGIDQAINPTLPDQISQSLSKREQQCLEYYVKGMSAKEIGKLLHLSIRTVENYVSNVKLKLNVSTKSDLIFKTRMNDKLDPK